MIWAEGQYQSNLQALNLLLEDEEADIIKKTP